MSKITLKIDKIIGLILLVVFCAAAPVEWHWKLALVIIALMCG